MKENEAIEVLSDFNKQVTAKADGAYQTNNGEMACKVAVKALEEIQQYRAIGTVEECRAAVEKQTAIEPIKIGDSNFEYQCPKCHFKLEIGYKHCISCGQLLKYSNEIRLE